MTTGADNFEQGILDCLPCLSGFAHMLSRNHALAEDLVQETVTRALTYRHQFKPGTNLRGWLIIILRNRYFNEIRRSRRDYGALYTQSEEIAASGGQEDVLELRDLKRQFAKLPDQQKEALRLIGVYGYSYEEAARITGCAIGTMKSRVCRARIQLNQVDRPEIDRQPEPALS